MTDMTPEQALRKLLATAEGNPFCSVGHLVEHGLGGADALRAALSRPPAGRWGMTGRELLEEIEALQADYKRLQDECKELRYILSRVAAAVEQQPAPDISALMEALETIQKTATHKSIRTGIHAATALGCIAAICNVTLADYRKGGEE